jgi:hypothetical protein
MEPVRYYYDAEVLTKAPEGLVVRVSGSDFVVPASGLWAPELADLEEGSTYDIEVTGEWYTQNLGSVPATVFSHDVG